MTTLIIHLDSQSPHTISPSIDAAYQLSKPDALIFGNIDSQSLSGIQNIIHFPKFKNTPITEIISILKPYTKAYTHIILHSDTIGIDAASYLSGSLGIPLLTHVSNIISKDIYECTKDNETHTVQVHSKRQIIAISSRFFTQKHSGIPNFKTLLLKPKTTITIKNPRSKAVMGIGNGASMHIEPLKELAKQFHMTLYGSKPIIDKKYLPTGRLLGISSKSIHTPLYFALGIAGDDYHMLGVKASLIIAINPDHNASIFKIADYGYVGNIQDILPLLQPYKLLGMHQ